MTLQEVRSSANAATELEIIRLNRTGWRISNSSIYENDPRRLLGYIERLETDRYEVLWLAAPISWAYVDSFELALAAIAERPQLSSIKEPEREPAARVGNTALFRPIRRRHPIAEV